MLRRHAQKELGGVDGLKIYIPLIEQAELETVVEEMKDQFLSIAEDGTPRLGKQSFQYIKDRMEGTVSNSSYDCSKQWKVFKLVQMFDPGFARDTEEVNTAWVEAVHEGVKAIKYHVGKEDMVRELLKYKVAVDKNLVFDRGNIDKYTHDVLYWWRNNKSELPNLAKAARIVFAMAPNSADCERMFSLLAILFPAQRGSALADVIQASIMLRYNKRSI